MKSSACYLLHAGFSLGLFFFPEDGSDVSPKRRLNFNELGGIISQKTELCFMFIIKEYSLL
jgi:hypothetical protein